MLINQATLSQFFSGGSTSTSTNGTSAEVLDKVSKTLAAKNTVAPKINAALTNDNTKLSALGKLMNGLTTFQSVAQSFSSTTPSTSKLDGAQLKAKITGLVDGFNSLNATMAGLRKGDLKSDAALANVRNQISAAFSGGVGSATTQALNDIGISAQADGTWAIDAKKLQSAIDADPSSVSSLFSNGGKGIADSLTGTIKNLLSSTGGIEQERTALNQDIASLNKKKSALEKSMTAQAQALAKIYSLQSGSGGVTGGRSSLLDMIG